jgi:Fe(3+) dicitrate transport protein
VRNRFPGSEAEIDVQYTQILPGFGATYSLPRGTTLFAGVHRGFAPPRPADVHRPEPGQPVVLVDAETSYNWELGGRIQPRAGVSAEATLFRLDFGNQIIEAPAGAGQRFTNGGRTVHQGVELAGHVSIGTLSGTPDDLTLAATLTYLPVARFSAGDERGADLAGNRLPYAPRTLASASATFAHRSGITAGASMEYTGGQFADAENTVDPTPDGQRGVLPSYSVIHAFASYAIPGTRLQIRTSARNVFDAVYITQRNEGIYTGMRRLVRAEVQWTFQQ